jgi:hypothetical protein
MTQTARVTLMVVRLVGVTMVVLGLLFWSGNAFNLLQVHMLLGFVLVVLLWFMAALALRAAVEPWLVGLAVIWGIIVPVLGLTQTRLLPGSLHWLVQVLHLAVGLLAIGLAESLAGRVQRRHASGALREARAS